MALTHLVQEGQCFAWQYMSERRVLADLLFIIYGHTRSCCFRFPPPQAVRIIFLQGIISFNTQSHNYF